MAQRSLFFRAEVESLEEAMDTCTSVTGADPASRLLVDHYFHSARGRLKLRQNAQGSTELIHLERLDSPLVRPLVRDKAPIADAVAHRRLLERNLGLQAVLPRRRHTFSSPEGFGPYELHLDIHLDDVEGLGTFLSVEVPAADEAHDSEAQNSIVAALEKLAVEEADAMPYSLADLDTMRGSARAFRAALPTGGSAGGEHAPRGRVVILDGASCSGKTTLSEWLLAQEDLGLSLIPRYCTRAPRPEELGGSEYIFVSLGEYRRRLEAGELIDPRDFEFGMSYGLSWQAAVEVLKSGGRGLGIMNLGNIRHVKRVFPEAVTVLIDAPLEVIRGRLVSRGANTQEQIDERLGNARRVHSYRCFYDHVVENDDGDLEAAQEQLLQILRA